MILIYNLLILFLLLDECTNCKTSRYVGKISYDGSKFYGYQKGGGNSKDLKKRTVQELLENKLTDYCNYPIKIIAASRTDRGVHALGQIIHFDAPNEKNINAVKLTEFINCNDLIITKCNIAPIGTLPIQLKNNLPFHALENAIYKHYRYKFILINEKIDPLERNYITNFMTHQRIKRKSVFNINNFQNCLNLFIGTHDFKSFGNELRKRNILTQNYKNESFNSIRTIYNITINNEIGTNIYYIDFYLNGALYKMIRNLIEAAIEVAFNEISIDYVSNLLYNCPSRDESIILTAPANGLYLVNVYYNECLFD